MVPKERGHRKARRDKALLRAQKQNWHMLGVVMESKLITIVPRHPESRANLFLCHTTVSSMESARTLDPLLKQNLRR